MSGMPWTKFFWSDFNGDVALRSCSLAAQGLWWRMLGIMHEATPAGYLTVGGQPCTPVELARAVGETPPVIEELLGELERRGIFSRNRAGVIYSRRVVRDSSLSEKRRKSGQKGAAVTNKKFHNNLDLPQQNERQTSGPRSQRPEARSQNLASLDCAREGVHEVVGLHRATAGQATSKLPPGHPRCKEVADRVRSISKLQARPADAQFVNGWLIDDFDPDKLIYPTVERLVAKLAARGDQVRTFKLLDLEVREVAEAARRADEKKVAEWRRISANPEYQKGYEAQQRYEAELAKKLRAAGEVGRD